MQKQPSTEIAPEIIGTNYNIRIISGNANPELAKDVAKILNTVLEECEVGKFADGETNIHIKNNVRGSDIFLIQPVCPPNVNDNLMELLLLIHTLKLASAKRITAVIPYYGYGRQDRKTKPRVPISASAVAQLIEAMGPSRVLTVDLHCGQIQGFFHDCPVDNLYAEVEFIKHVQTMKIPDDELAIISPDAGGVARARRVADKVGAHSVVTILKRRVAANVIDSMQLVGEVTGKICFIFDDMIDTGGTLCKAAELLKQNGAKKVFACATHGLLSSNATERINNSVLEGVWVSDSIPQKEHLEKCPKLHVLSLVPLLAQAISKLHYEQSLSDLFRANE